MFYVKRVTVMNLLLMMIDFSLPEERGFVKNCWQYQHECSIVKITRYFFLASCASAFVYQKFGEHILFINDFVLQYTNVYPTCLICGVFILFISEHLLIVLFCYTRLKKKKT